MPRFFIVGVLIFLLLAAAGSSQTTQAARYIPWDCADWAAFAHEDRATSILESLAENRGKTLYCGIDQSDTFAKAETWEAGRDHNERDDTVYWGERGSFRGFIAAQEGWLTDGESGITGQSIAVIFEFPREEKRRVNRTKRFSVGTDPEQFPINAVASCGQVLGLICTGESNPSWTGSGQVVTSERKGRTSATGLNDGTTRNRISWDTNIRYWHSGAQHNTQQPVNPKTPWWEGQAAAFADRACRARGARMVAGSAEIGRGHNENDGAGDYQLGPYLGFFLRSETSGGNIRHRGRQSRTWTAKCKKTVRRTR